MGTNINLNVTQISSISALFASTSPIILFCFPEKKETKSKKQRRFCQLNHHHPQFLLDQKYTEAEQITEHNSTIVLRKNMRVFCVESQKKNLGMGTPCCQGLVAFLLKFLNFLQTFIGVSIIIYSAYMLNHWQHHNNFLPPNLDSESSNFGSIMLNKHSLPTPWYCFFSYFHFFLLAI